MGVISPLALVVGCGIGSSLGLLLLSIRRMLVLDDDNDALRAASQLCQARANDLHSILNPLLASLEADTLDSTEIGNIVIDFNNSTNCHEQRQFAHNGAHGRVQVYID